jgi:DNA-directed RNA polymerase subunit RPC12/RpoP
LVGDEYTVISRYTNNRTKVIIRHNRCGYEYDILPDGFTKQGNRCANCSERRTRKLTHDEFIDRINKVVGDEYTVIGTYTKSSVPIEMVHNTCNYSWKIRPNNFIHHGQRCPKCANETLNKQKTKTHRQFANEVFYIFGVEYTVLGEYTHNKNKIKVRHNVCCNVYDAQPSCLLNGNGCKKCSDKLNGLKRRKTHDVLEQEIRKKGNGEYILLSEYLGDNKHIKLKHLVCGHKYSVTPSNFLSGYRCPACNESKGERRIREFLQDKFNFQVQYKFDDLLGRNGHPLRFDFGILDNLDRLVYLIEYDGEYHYLPIINQWRLEYQREHDELKNTYCKNNNIPLLRIPYWEFDSIEKKIIEFNNFIKKGD